MVKCHKSCTCFVTMSYSYTTDYEKNETGYKMLEANIRYVVQAVVTFIFFSLLCRSWIIIVARALEAKLGLSLPLKGLCSYGNEF